jgi:hypothetical protein
MKGNKLSVEKAKLGLLTTEEAEKLLRQSGFRIREIVFYGRISLPTRNANANTTVEFLPPRV